MKRPIAVILVLLVTAGLAVACWLWAPAKLFLAEPAPACWVGIAPVSPGSVVKCGIQHLPVRISALACPDEALDRPVNAEIRVFTSPKAKEPKVRYRAEGVTLRQLRDEPHSLVLPERRIVARPLPSSSGVWLTLSIEDEAGTVATSELDPELKITAKRPTVTQRRVNSYLFPWRENGEAAPDDMWTHVLVLPSGGVRVLGEGAASQAACDELARRGSAFVLEEKGVFHITEPELLRAERGTQFEPKLAAVPLVFKCKVDEEKPEPGEWTCRVRVTGLEINVNSERAVDLVVDSRKDSEALGQAAIWRDRPKDGPEWQDLCRRLGARLWVGSTKKEEPGPELLAGEIRTIGGVEFSQVAKTDEDPPGSFTLKVTWKQDYDAAGPAVEVGIAAGQIEVGEGSAARKLVPEPARGSGLRVHPAPKLDGTCRIVTDPKKDPVAPHLVAGGKVYVKFTRQNHSPLPDAVSLEQGGEVLQVAAERQDVGTDSRAWEVTARQGTGLAVRVTPWFKFTKLDHKRTKTQSELAAAAGQLLVVQKVPTFGELAQVKGQLVQDLGSPKKLALLPGIDLIPDGRKWLNSLNIKQVKVTGCEVTGEPPKEVDGAEVFTGIFRPGLEGKLALAGGTLKEGKGVLTKARFTLDFNLAGKRPTARSPVYRVHVPEAVTLRFNPAGERAPTWAEVKATHPVGDITINLKPKEEKTIPRPTELTLQALGLTPKPGWVMTVEILDADGNWNAVGTQQRENNAGLALQQAFSVPIPAQQPGARRPQVNLDQFVRVKMKRATEDVAIGFKPQGVLAGVVLRYDDPQAPPPGRKKDQVVNGNIQQLVVRQNATIEVVGVQVKGGGGAPWLAIWVRQSVKDRWQLAKLGPAEGNQRPLAAPIKIQVGKNGQKVDLNEYIRGGPFPLWWVKKKDVSYMGTAGEKKKDFTYVVNSVGMKFATVRPVPQSHLYVGACEVTTRQYQEVVMGQALKKADDTDMLPAVRISPQEAEAFCRKLSERDGRTYRLPTDAEWKHACRAGAKKTDKYSFGSDVKRLKDAAWFNDNSGDKTHPVMTRKPNELGLYDMHGNVSEWVKAPLRGKYWARGGAFGSTARRCEIGAPMTYKETGPATRMADTGFRVVFEE